MNPSNYSKIQNTPLGVSNLYSPVSSVLFSGKDINVVANTSLGSLTIVLDPYRWQQAVIATLVINNVAGANNINLVSSNNPDPFIPSRVLQSVLRLTLVGSSVILKIVRSGVGTATISVNGVQVMDSSTVVAYVLVQATNVTPNAETNIITPVLGDTGGVGYVTLATNQVISGIKTFTGAPVISTITNTGTLTLPTTTGTVALVSQIPTNADYVDRTTNQTVGGVKTLSSQLLITPNSNQLVLGTTNTTTLTTSATTPRTITFPNASGTVALVGGGGFGEMQFGSGISVFTNANFRHPADAPVPVTFSTPFSSTPRVIVSNGGGDLYILFSVTLVSTTGFTVNAVHLDQKQFTGNVTFNWFAIV